VFSTKERNNFFRIKVNQRIGKPRKAVKTAAKKEVRRKIKAKK